MVKTHSVEPERGLPEGGRDGSLGRAVLCVSHGELRRQVTRTCEDEGFEVLATVDRGLEVLPAVAEFTPDVVVLDLALGGALGLRLFGLIKTLAPEVALIVLAPWQTAHAAAVEAGADVVVAIDDLRRLRAVLHEVADSLTT